MRLAPFPLSAQNTSQSILCGVRCTVLSRATQIVFTFKAPERWHVGKGRMKLMGALGDVRAGPLLQVLGGCNHNQLWMKRYKDRYKEGKWLWLGIRSWLFPPGPEESHGAPRGCSAHGCSCLAAWEASLAVSRWRGHSARLSCGYRETPHRHQRARVCPGNRGGVTPDWLVK